MTIEQAKKKVIELAKSEVGYKAGKGKWTKYAADMDALGDYYNYPKQGVDYCDIFFDWLFVKSFGSEIGRKMIYQPKKSTGAGCGFSAGFYRANNAFTNTPQIGAQIFYGTPGNESHTGIVIDLEPNWVWTVEANTGGGNGQVQKKKVSRSANISGYGIPNWKLATTTEATTYKAIDVSVFNGDINWSKVKADGITAAIVRVGGRYGASGKMYTDSRGEGNITAALNAGLKVGAYYFSQAINEAEAIAEAEFCIKQLKGFKGKIEMPVYYDTEYLKGGRHNNISASKRTALAKAFCETIKKAGYKTGVYASITWLNNNLNMSQLKDFEVWVAQYYKECQYKGSYGMWQYTNEGKVSGISGPVDLDYGYKKYWEGDTPKPTPKPTPPKPKKGLDVDGVIGEDSTKALQKWLGTPQDGEFSGQVRKTKKYTPNIITNEYDDEYIGSAAVKALQNALKRAGYSVGAYGTDGLWGRDTVKAWQRFLAGKGYKVGDIDGILGDKTGKATQQFLNKVVFGV